MHFLGYFHELGVVEVGFAGTVDVRSGFLAQLFDIGTADAVLADEGQTLLFVGVRSFSRTARFCVVGMHQLGVGKVLQWKLVALHSRRQLRRLGAKFLCLWSRDQLHSFRVFSSGLPCFFLVT